MREKPIESDGERRDEKIPRLEKDA